MKVSERLRRISEEKKSILCVGLDSDISLIPDFLFKYENPLLEFNKAIIQATAPFAAAYKLNTAFYEVLGQRGWDILEQTLRYLPENAIKIADAKRGDIGNTSNFYAKAFFETLPFDCITVNPYMGRDSVLPFLSYPHKMVFILALTSNEGAYDFQLSFDGSPQLYEKVIQKSLEWQAAGVGEVGFVVGATQAEHLEAVRKIAPDTTLLIPGVGAQGGNLQDVCQYGNYYDGNLLINVSRSIAFASRGSDFKECAEQEAQKICQEIQMALRL